MVRDKQIEKQLKKIGLDIEDDEEYNLFSLIWEEAYDLGYSDGKKDNE